MTVGVRVACDLVNELVVAPANEPGETLRELFAFDPESLSDLRARHTSGFTGLAAELHGTVTALDQADLDTAAGALNTLLTRSPAHPHLAKEDGTWSLHHHPVDSDVVGSWTAICAEALARLVGAGYGDRVHLCEAADCRRAYVDTTKNGTRRFCSTTCQNRVKAAARRRRLATQ
jgi:predicted RNA-binding Zn ribbon-like protein